MSVIAIPAPPIIAPANDKTAPHSAKDAPPTTHAVEISSMKSAVLRIDCFSMSGVSRFAKSTPSTRNAIMDKSNASRAMGEYGASRKYDPTKVSSIHARYAARPMKASGNFGSLGFIVPVDRAYFSFTFRRSFAKRSGRILDFSACHYTFLPNAIFLL